ncbi:MAG: hypothetical protein KIH63_002945, partial [Candidatus Saccharibacteria bacterium]|nr:hypothetical protein [Candidatus Saccharibacteria bacterium]
TFYLSYFECQAALQGVVWGHLCLLTTEATRDQSGCGVFAYLLPLLAKVGRLDSRNGWQTKQKEYKNFCLKSS